MKKSKTWSWSVGDRGLTVSVREYKRPGGIIYIGALDPMTNRIRWVSLGHRDKIKAQKGRGNFSLSWRRGEALSVARLLGTSSTSISMSTSEP